MNIIMSVIFYSLCILSLILAISGIGMQDLNIIVLFLLTASIIAFWIVIESTKQRMKNE